MALAPAPDFRYVGLEPIVAPRLGVAGAALGLGAAVTLALSSVSSGGHAVLAGAMVSALSAFVLHDARGSAVTTGSARMAIVPWGVLVDIDDTPRILRWAAIRTIDIQTSRARRLVVGPALSSRVAITTEHDRFVGVALGAVTLEQLIEHVQAYASEQGTPIALDLGGGGALGNAEVVEPSCEMLISTARDWLGTAAAVVELGLEPAGYRRASALAPTRRAVEVLRAMLRDRTPRDADHRAFAAVVAAELGAKALVPDLVALAQCPHVLVAAVARQAATKLGASRAMTGTLDELAPFLFDADRERLEVWGKNLAAVETRVT